jgi:hypothetical protein
MYKFKWLCLAVLAGISLQSCKKDTLILTTDTRATNSNMVLLWNLAGCDAIMKTGAVPPMAESRTYAMINVAMHDALNAIEPRYETYALKGAPHSAANADAAVAQAAHDIIVALFPSQQQSADSLLAISLDNIAAETKDEGIVVGKAAAQAMIDKRLDDGASIAQFAYVQGTLAGAYRAIASLNLPEGFVAIPGWGKVAPFGLTSFSQFRAAVPYTINSAEYTADFDEIKRMGCKDCVERTADQTEIGQFWLDNVPLSWNRITRGLIVERQMDAWSAAYLLALVQMAEADANISSFDSKFFYNYWRPLTAIQLADDDGNPNTTGDAKWAIMGVSTPPVPDYPSNHAADGGAAAEVLRNYFKTDNIPFSATSVFLPGVTRKYKSFSQAAREVSLSRIYVGYHFRNAVMAGEAQGRQVGQYIYNTCLLKKAIPEHENIKKLPQPLIAFPKTPVTRNNKILQAP